MKLQETLWSLIAVLSTIVVTSTVKGVTVYTDRTSFESSAFALSLEDFESADVSDGSISDFFSAPLDASTDNVVFSPGDIVSGISFSENHAGIKLLQVIGRNAPLFGTTVNSKHLTFQECNAGLEINLPNGNSAFGFDLFDFVGNVALDISLFSPSGIIRMETLSLPNQPATGPIFVGFTSAMDDIVRVTFDSQSNHYYSVDNVAFGHAVPTPKPSSLLLMVVGPLVYVIIRRRRGTLKSVKR